MHDYKWWKIKKKKNAEKIHLAFGQIPNTKRSQGMV